MRSVGFAIISCVATAFAAANVPEPRASLGLTHGSSPAEATCPRIVKHNFTASEARESLLIRAAGGLQLFIRTYPGAMHDLEAFLVSFYMWWPRHLSKHNLVVIFDDEDAEHAAAGVALKLKFPCLIVQFTNELRYAPGFKADELWPGTMAPKLIPKYKRHSNATAQRNRGYDRQQWHWFHLDFESSSGLIAFFDADALIQAPVTFKALFAEGADGKSLKPIVIQREPRRFQSGCAAMLGNETCLKSDRESMMFFPIIVHRDTLRNLRHFVSSRADGAPFAEIFSKMARVHKYSQFDITFTFAARHESERYQFAIDRDASCFNPPPLSLVAHKATSSSARTCALSSFFKPLCIGSDENSTLARQQLASALMTFEQGETKGKTFFTANIRRCALLFYACDILRQHRPEEWGLAASANFFDDAEWLPLLSSPGHYGGDLETTCSRHYRALGWEKVHAYGGSRRKAEPSAETQRTGG